jgi:hypothetical protein
MSGPQLDSIYQIPSGAPRHQPADLATAATTQRPERRRSPLHIQIAMGWSHSHLHRFLNAMELYGMAEAFHAQLETTDASQLSSKNVLLSSWISNGYGKRIAPWSGVFVSPT